MSSNLVNAALAALLVGSTGLALADNDGRGRHQGGGDHHGWQERGGDGGAPRWDASPAHPQYHPPYQHPYGHDHWQPAYGWKHGHPHHSYYERPHGYHGYYPRPYSDYGDDITIIFRGRLD
jgi:hypothetical protein